MNRFSQLYEYAASQGDTWRTTFLELEIIATAITATHCSKGIEPKAATKVSIWFVGSTNILFRKQAVTHSQVNVPTITNLCSIRRSYKKYWNIQARRLFRNKSSLIIPFGFNKT